MKTLCTHFVKGAAMLAMGLLLHACGGADSQVVKQFAYDVTDNQVAMGVEFNPNFELNTDVNVPILQYGNLKLVSSTPETGFKVMVGLNLDAFVDPDFIRLERTRLLPNGQPMSSYVTTEVARLRIQAHEKIAANLYFGIDPNKLYLGTALEIGFIDGFFPAGLVISQQIKGANGRSYGVITLYGPEVLGGRVIHSGGIFVMTNVSDLIRYAQEDGRSSGHALEMADEGAPGDLNNLLVPDSATFINEQYREKYSKPKNLQRLLDLYRKRGLEDGMIDR